MLGQFDENDRFRRKLEVTRTNIEDNGMLQPEYHKPLQVLYVAARLIG